MIRIGNAVLAALTTVGALGATPVAAQSGPPNSAQVSNPANTYSLPSLSGALIGGQQTQYIGQTFTAPITGALTGFQFTLNSSDLRSVYGAVYGWNGSAPTTELWRSAIGGGGAGLKEFAPTGVTVTQGQTYVAFLSTYGLADNAGLATVGTCLPFANCGSNDIPNLGALVTGIVYPDGVAFNRLNYLDATFSATITAVAGAVPEPATWALMICGFGAVGGAMRRRRRIATAVRLV